jgi:hypothetical protein
MNPIDSLKIITTLLFYLHFIYKQTDISCIYLYPQYTDRYIQMDTFIDRSHLGCNHKWLVYQLIWPCSICRNKIEIVFWRDGRVVDSSGLENRYSSEQRTIEGSNPSLSFFLLVESFFIGLICCHKR